jgi:hypothetical protein
MFSAVKEIYFEKRAIGPGNVDHNRVPLSIEFRDFCFPDRSEGSSNEFAADPHSLGTLWVRSKSCGYIVRYFSRRSRRDLPGRSLLSTEKGD